MRYITSRRLLRKRLSRRLKRGLLIYHQGHKVHKGFKSNLIGLLYALPDKTVKGFSDFPTI